MICDMANNHGHYRLNLCLNDEFYYFKAGLPAGQVEGP